MSDHRLSVKTVRCLGIPHNEKLCTLCNDNHIADEIRFVLECNGLSCIRLKYLESRFCERANIFFKFCELMSTLQVKKLKTLYLSVKYMNSSVLFYFFYSVPLALYLHL